MRALTEKEIEAIVLAAEADERAESPRHRAKRSVLYRIAALTGARYGQLVQSLAWGDIDFERGTITYDRAHSKNGNGATLPLHPKALELLKALRKDCEVADATDFVFPVKIQDRIIDHDIRASGVRKRDASGRPASFHSLRKSFATSLVANGVPVNVAQRLLQHKTVQMTLEIYAEVQESGLIDGLSTLQVFRSNGIVTKNKKNFSKGGESLDGDGEIADDDLNAVRRSTQFKSPTPGGDPLGEQHSTDGLPSGDGDFLPRGFAGSLGSPRSVVMGGSSPPLGIRNGESGKTGGDSDEDSPLVATAESLIELALKLLRQAKKGPACDNSRRIGTASGD